MKKFKNGILLSLVLFSIFMFSVGIIEAQEEITLKFSWPGVKEGAIGTHAVNFKTLVEDWSDKRIKVNIFPNNQLGSELESFQGVGIGNIEMSSGSLLNLSSVAPSLEVLTLPYIFENEEQALKVLDRTLKEKINDIVIKEAGVRVLGWRIGGWRILTNSKRSITTIEDLKGLKMRVARTSLMIDTWKAYGVNPTSTSWAELFTSLQQGVVDAMEQPAWVISRYGFDEVQDYVTNIHTQLWIGATVINEQVYQNLPQDLQEVITRAAEISINMERQVFAYQNEKSLNDMIKNGMEYYELEDEEEWIKRAKTVWPKYTKTKEQKDFLELIEKEKY